MEGDEETSFLGKNMFVVCFGDGLGNQMFQYAFYCSIKDNYPANTVKMDIFNIYGGHIHNGFELSKVFNIKIDECEKSEAIRLSDYWPQYENKYRFYNFLAKIRSYLFGIKESHISQDDPTEYYNEVYNLSSLKSYIFVGNWANELYLNRVENIIREKFVFPLITNEDKQNYEYLKKINESNAVAVHVRKGDYLVSEMINLTMDYYRLAKEAIEEKVNNPKYFIFSDSAEDLNEIEDLFTDSIVVTGNKGSNSYIDMQLMSMCKHNIIANSTFSFWGAYLNSNKDKVVIAPSKAAKQMRHPFACKEWKIINIESL